MNEKNVSFDRKKGATPKRLPEHRYFYVTLFALVLAFFNLPSGQASDHGDDPAKPSSTHGKEIGRHGHTKVTDFARLTDLYAFVREDNLVIALCSGREIMVPEEDFHFLDNVTFKIYLDKNSRVDFSNSDSNDEFGGTVKWPARISEDITFTITSQSGIPYLEVEGLPKLPPVSQKCAPSKAKGIQCFAGLRDDPFIRNPRTGKNVAAIVLEFPLIFVTPYQSTLLIWATSEIQESGKREHAGRALRSQFMPKINTLHPSQHLSQLKEVPDVMICNTSKPSKFPNCRELKDDVVQYLVCNEFISPSMLEGFIFPKECTVERRNDKDFRDDFPFLAKSHSK